MAGSEQVVVLFATVFFGIALGRISWRGFSLGTSGVIFTGLLAGHLGYEIPRIVGLLGLAVFVYCLGIDAGPRFFRVFFQEGKRLAVVGALMIFSAMLAAWAFASLAGLPRGLAAGILAGSLTSTPALGAASEVLLREADETQLHDLAVGFGIAYPVGTLAVILFVQFASKVLGNPNSSAEEDDSSNSRPIIQRLVSVLHPKLTGRRLSELTLLNQSPCQISRQLVDGQLQPIPGDFRLAVGQALLVVGAQPDVELITDYFGEEKQEPQISLNVDQQHRRVVVTSSSNVVGKTLRELHLRSKFGVTIARIFRHDVEFVPDADEAIQFGDALVAVGELEGLEQFVTFAGHRERSFDETDLISLGFGLLLGALVGQVHFEFAGEAIALGLAGGPLLVGLVMGHFGRVGPFAGHFPRAARLLLTESGLALFLAQAGVQAGGQFADVLRDHGLILCLGATVIAITPLIVGGLVTRFLIPLGTLQTLGAVCGAMTSTPGLGAITSKVESKIPATSYATVYPLALILMSLLAP
ncbi:MAG: hypothetical protein KDA84_25805, partial [Planctomycetaceae bacterium]|nr:hypothetical protein [Planctomycetaceae bacterium]